jgi:hypothetical protein
VGRVKQPQFIYCTTRGEHRAEGRIVILLSPIVALKGCDLVAQSSDSGLKGLVGSGGSFRLLIWNHPDKCEAGIVINE